jgi:hypothetical protein
MIRSLFLGAIFALLASNAMAAGNGTPYFGSTETDTLQVNGASTLSACAGYLCGNGSSLAVCNPNLPLSVLTGLGSGVPAALAANANSGGGFPTYLTGADPTGTTDSAPAFAAACAANPGATINVPPGVYWWNTGEDFVSACRFLGHGFNERNNSPSTPETGTWIKITNPSISPITWEQPNDGGTGGFSHIAFEQAQPTPGAGWAPTVYPPLITLLGQASYVLDDIYFYNFYSAISAPGTGGSTGRLQISHIKGQVFSSLFYGTAILDLEHIDDIHLWPFWSDNVNVVEWT